eukprot:GHVR01070366.1.p2 GENE.GHVR01070366.1~~GHVR01070366.1.p2  ORF type:complete len:157 (+),score=29.69 GHVR01070366.1:309-779(+)
MGILREGTHESRTRHRISGRAPWASGGTDRCRTGPGREFRRHRADCFRRRHGGIERRALGRLPAGEETMTDNDRQTILSRLRAAIESNPGRGVIEIEVDDLDIARIDLGDGTATLVGPLAYEVDPADAYDDRDEREAEDRAEREAQIGRINAEVVL